MYVQNGVGFLKKKCYAYYGLAKSYFLMKEQHIKKVYRTCNNQELKNITISDVAICCIICYLVHVFTADLGYLDDGSD